MSGFGHPYKCKFIEYHSGWTVDTDTVATLKQWLNSNVRSGTRNNYRWKVNKRLIWGKYTTIIKITHEIYFVYPEDALAFKLVKGEGQ